MVDSSVALRLSSTRRYATTIWFEFATISVLAVRRSGAGMAGSGKRLVCSVSLQQCRMTTAPVLAIVSKTRFDDQRQYSKKRGSAISAVRSAFRRPILRLLSTQCVDKCAYISLCGEFRCSSLRFLQKSGCAPYTAVQGMTKRWKMVAYQHTSDHR